MLAAQRHSEFKIGIIHCPISVRLYSIRDGTCRYSVRSTMPSRSSSFS